ncbi:MAG: helix-hairpin-helix domain-containing protein [Clostridiales bacterium]|jgi:competence protein ComEA|nr:helix-hairpin-helix domain-containing protein [Clostridiales bacterium]
MNNKKEALYLSIIGLLVLVIIGMSIYKKDSTEPIIFNGGVVATDDATANLAENSDGSTDSDDTSSSGSESDSTSSSSSKSSTKSSTKTAKKPTSNAVKPSPTPAKIQQGEAKININTATLAQLTRIPGVGESTAQKIIDYRTTKGNFIETKDIKKVNGIGDAKFEGMKDFITVE